MKSLKSLFMGLAVTGAIILLSSASFADEGKEQAKIKGLNEAAAALQQSNPTLAAGLTKFANEEAAEKEEKNEKKESEGIKEEGMKKQHAEHIKLLRDAGAALKVAHPELAISLLEMADNSEKRMMMKEDKEDKNEKDEKSENGQKK